MKYISQNIFHGNMNKNTNLYLKMFCSYNEYFLIILSNCPLKFKVAK